MGIYYLDIFQAGRLTVKVSICRSPSKSNVVKNLNALLTLAPICGSFIYDRHGPVQIIICWVKDQKINSDPFSFYSQCYWWPKHNSSISSCLLCLGMYTIPTLYCIICKHGPCPAPPLFYRYNGFTFFLLRNQPALATINSEFSPSAQESPAAAFLYDQDLYTPSTCVTLAPSVPLKTAYMYACGPPPQPSLRKCVLKNKPWSRYATKRAKL